MAYAQVNEKKRIVTWLADEFVDNIPEDDRSGILANFPIFFSNPEIFEQTVSYQTEDYRIENGLAIFDPLLESRDAMIRNEVMNSVPEYLENTDNAICYLYEETLAQQETIDDQDAAICALYEMIGA